MALPQAHLPRSPPPLYPAVVPGYESLPPGPPGLDDPRSRMPQDVLSSISQRVKNATGHAELQVLAELRRMESSMAALADKVRRVETLLSRNSKAKGSDVVMQEKLEAVLVKMEQRFEKELQTIKRDLHHTIIVHNHNADLMADHKAAIDTIESSIEEPHEDKPTLAQVHTKQMYEHLAQISATLEESTQQDVSDLLERGEAILQRVGKTLAASASSISMYHHPQSMPPGSGPPSAMHYGPPEAYLGSSDMMVHSHMPPYAPPPHHYYGPPTHFAPPMHYPHHHLMMR